MCLKSADEPFFPGADGVGYNEGRSAAVREGDPGRAEGGSVPVGAGSDDRSHHRGMRDKTVCGEGAFP